MVNENHPALDSYIGRKSGFLNTLFLPLPRRLLSGNACLTPTFGRFFGFLRGCLCMVACLSGTFLTATLSALLSATLTLREFTTIADPLQDPVPKFCDPVFTSGS